MKLKNGFLSLSILISSFLLLSVTTKSHCQIENSNWEIRNPNDFGLNKNVLDQLKSDLNSGVFNNTHEIIIIKDGHLVFEHYSNNHVIDDLHYTASISKSIGSIIFGLAIDRGILPGLSSGIIQSPISELLPDHRDLFLDEKSGIKLHHVLNMSTTLEWDEESFPYNDDRNDWVKARNNPDPVRFAFSKPLTGVSGERFEYHGGMSITLSHIVDQALDSNITEFVEDNLFDPLAIIEYRWTTISNGLLDFDGGLSLRPRDMAKIGQLMLNDGKWKGEQIISREWVMLSTEMHIQNQGSPDYGYQWWGGKYAFYDKECSMFMASGHGGQIIVVIPEINMVSVITQQVFNNPMGQVNTIGLLAKYILPAAIPVKSNLGSIPIKSLENLTGEYTWNQAQLEIIMEDGNLTAIGGDGSRIVLNPIGENDFIGLAINTIPVHFKFNGNSLRTRFAFQDQEYTRKQK